MSDTLQHDGSGNTKAKTNRLAADIVLPNIRKLFIPDAGCTLFDADLAGADAQVVAWEAEDEDLKAAFRKKIDVHHKNGEDMWGTTFTRLVKGTHAYDEKRQELKRGVHLTNYGGSARGMAMALGWLVHDAEKFQARWFSIHPGIKRNFHGRVQSCLDTSRTVYNKFGFRRVFFDRPDAAFTEALAWIPQSTVALTTYQGAFNLEEKYPKLRLREDILLQVHDSLIFQFPNNEIPDHNEIKKTLEVKIPYDDPLTIPWGLAVSNLSWGDVKKV